jgi:hypothetical protein
VFSVFSVVQILLQIGLRAMPAPSHSWLPIFFRIFREGTTNLTNLHE